MKSRNKTIVLPYITALACISLDQKTLFKFLQLQNGPHVSKMSTNEKKILSHLLTAKHLKATDVPCQKIWNLKK